MEKSNNYTYMARIYTIRNDLIKNVCTSTQELRLIRDIRDGIEFTEVLSNGKSSVTYHFQLSGNLMRYSYSGYEGIYHIQVELLPATPAARILYGPKT